MASVQVAPMATDLQSKPVAKPDVLPSAETTTTTATLRRRRRDPIEILNQRYQEWFADNIKDLERVKRRRVAVLLLAWNSKTNPDTPFFAEEIEDLKNVFEEKYNFKVRVGWLDSHNPLSPRYQASEILVDFFKEYDKPGTLCIVHYGGHAKRSGEELIMQSGCKDLGPDQTELRWDVVEGWLTRLRSDLLLILDTCYSGVVNHSLRTWPASKAHFECMSSTTFNRTANSPRSDGSFTRALISALHELSAKGSFRTDELQRQIEANTSFRRLQKQSITISSCGKENTSYLVITPLPPGQMDLPTPVEPLNQDDPKFYLHLSYVFTQEPTETNINALVSRIYDLVKTDRLPIYDVCFEGFSNYRPRMQMADAAEKVLGVLGQRLSSKGHETTPTKFDKTLKACQEMRRPQRTLTTLSRDDRAIPSAHLTQPKGLSTSHALSALASGISKAPTSIFSSKHIQQIRWWTLILLVYTVLVTGLFIWCFVPL